MICDASGARYHLRKRCAEVGASYGKGIDPKKVSRYLTKKAAEETEQGRSFLSADALALIDDDEFILSFAIDSID